MTALSELTTASWPEAPRRTAPPGPKGLMTAPARQARLRPSPWTPVPGDVMTALTAFDTAPRPRPCRTAPDPSREVT